MLRRAFLLPVWLAIALSGCTAEHSSTTPPATPEEPARTRPDVPLSQLLDSAFERREDGSLVVLDRLNEPRRVEVEPVENRHVSGQVDTLRTLVYDGLELEVYAVTDGNELLQEVRLMGEGYETVEGLGVGSPREAVREALGAPLRTEGDTLIYEIESSPDDPTPTMLTVRFDGDRVGEMAWRYYVD